ncbi:hypothetical protein [Legionella micdadei]|uniref:Alpha/beta hydrolase n=1 Tax=Legionella micdadei TaxID=451 RepID=A0A098GF87_LEGMI|nr:hypothetical protein [Legionella micdadei]ARG97764.1 hypothetical protein B6N58_08860 [Legionella micdadei]ARG99923.1 hypothetical protein B6V88_05560 [Legionella micdadei]KTD28468.1 hypothetical protein Lmic_1579 [Legionella micdadei]NSL18760.1 hypothetical protein [Legionella micdadei]CEG60642.1 conserved membrane protein of unknown function [Legionella micdadei]
MKKGEIYAGGLELNFFESAQLESNNNDPASIARDALRILMMGWKENWRDLGSKRVLEAIFIERDHELVREMRLAFQQGFNYIFEQLQNKELSEKQLNQAQLFISNCMTLLPFADLNPYESFTIPQLINGQWQMVEYKVTPIELTPTKGFSKLLIEDYDRVFAYGLEPIANQQATPHLIFMGTTYPAGQGFTTQVNTDLEAWSTPGQSLYAHGRERVLEWIDRQEKKPHVCGTSLGGSLSLLLAIDQGDKLSRVDALNPPGMHEPWCWDTRFNHWDDFDGEHKPPVYVQKQEDDVVSPYGDWENDWHVLHVIPPESKKGPNGFAAHALNYAGFAETKFVGVDTVEDNKERRWRNFFIFTLLRGFAYYLGHQPYRLFVLPTIRFVLNNKLASTLILAFILASIFLLPLLPTAAAATLITVGLIPITMFFVYKVYNAIQTILGWNEVKFAECHDPSLPRNTEMDIYTNEMTQSFTYEEIRTYYEAKRCTLKGKAFLPDNKPEKREILEKSLDHAYRDQTVQRTATKAKIHDMKQTVQLLKQFHLLNSDKSQLKEALHKQQEAYAMGKQGISLSLV